MKDKERLEHPREGTLPPSEVVNLVTWPRNDPPSEEMSLDNHEELPNCLLLDRKDDLEKIFVEIEMYAWRTWDEVEIRRLY